MNSREDQVKHLEMIQVVINRLAGNTFLIKGWTVTFVTAILVLAVGQKSWAVAVLAAVGATVFGVLDAYYLRLERMFRCLYQQVDAGTVESEGGGYAFSMNARKFSKHEECRFWRVLTSPSVLWLYGLLIVGATVVGAVMGMASG